VVRASAVDTASFALPQPFWSTFMRRHWERKPVVFDSPFVAPLTTPEAAFAALVRAASERPRRQLSGDARFYIENAQVLADAGRYLPRTSDGSIAGYAARATRQIGGRRFGLVVGRFQVYDEALWFRVREFLGGLVAAAAPRTMPPGVVNLTLFLGTYRHTPYGVHLGGASNFKFVIAGRKRMRVWHDASVRDKDALSFTNRYRGRLAGSIALDGGPGDVLYFPSDCWHVAEDSGRLSLSISLDLFLESEPTHDPPSAAELLLLSINRSTASGFDDVPPARPPRRLGSADVIRGDPRQPIRWTTGSGRELVCSANGHACSAPRLRAVTNLLVRLKRGRAPARRRSRSRPLQSGIVARRCSRAPGKALRISGTRGRAWHRR